jgi:CubicO group peptidase (beta-lactamase class C family)
LAAYVVEKITGMTFEDYVREEIFDPLDMPTATIS